MGDLAAELGQGNVTGEGATARATSQIKAVSALVSARADRWRGSSTVHALGCVRDNADPLAATASDLIHLVRPGQGCSSSIRPSGTCAPEDRRNQTALADQPRLKSCDSDGRAAIGVVMRCAPSPRPPGGLPHGTPGAGLTGSAGGRSVGCARRAARSGVARPRR
jgi:hypothetical protein